jgi:hypothetical protein
MMAYLVGWALIAVFSLGLQFFHPVFIKSFNGLSDNQWHQLILLFAVGAAALSWGLRGMPSAGVPGDIGPLPARLILACLMGLGAFMRLHGANSVPANYWDDFSLPLNDAVQVLENHRFFVYGSSEPGEPMFAYALALVLYLFPRIDGILAERLILTGFDLAGIWIIYLAGKELGKRRIGLLAASFWAINHALLMMVLSYMRFPTLPPVMALILLFSFRLFKKPNLSHFLEWGASVALGYYTYTAFRPMGPYFMIAVMLWVLRRNNEGLSKSWGRLWGCTLSGSLALLFIYEHRFILSPALKNGADFMMASHWIMPVLGLALAAFFYKILSLARQQKISWEILYWSYALFLFGAMVYPMLSDNFLARRMANLSVLSSWDVPKTFFSTVTTLAHRVYLSIQTLYYSGNDRYDMNLFGDPYFDVADVIFILPGVVYAFCRPTWLKTYILLAAGVGLVPHIMADPGGSRLADCVAPFLLLGAVALNEAFEGSSETPSPGLWKTLLVALWMGLVGFGAVTLYQKAYFHFMMIKGPQCILTEQVAKDWAANRVYLADYEGMELSDQPLDEKNTVYRFSTDGNTIYLGPNENPSDLVVLLKIEALPEPDILDKLKAQFPMGQWTETKIYPDRPGDKSFMERLWIPGSGITSDPTKLIHWERIPAYRWTRKFYGANYRIGYGVIRAEDRVEDVDAPFLPAVTNAKIGTMTARFEENFTAPTDGKYVFQVETDRPLDLWLGDQIVIHARPFWKGHYKGSIHLDAGSHPLRLMIPDPDPGRDAKISVRYPGSDDWKPL